jgi:mannose-6-phosphate isomerase-like protein (cupin superfamily)
VETLPTVRPLAAPDTARPALETPAAICHHLPAGGAAPDGCELVVPLPDATRFAYACRAATSETREVAIDPFLRGNAFRPLHESATTLAAMLSVAAGRRLDTGPESERVLLVLRGQGLLFLQNGDTLRAGTLDLVFAPAGEPLRVWSQGPDDLLALVVQPQGAPAERRTLAGELAKRRAQTGGSSSAAP